VRCASLKEAVALRAPHVAVIAHPGGGARNQRIPGDLMKALDSAEILCTGVRSGKPYGSK